MLNFILFKIVFSGVILDLLGWDAMPACAMWFTVLGFMKSFTLLAGDRFDYVRTFV